MKSTLKALINLFSLSSIYLVFTSIVIGQETSVDDEGIRDLLAPEEIPEMDPDSNPIRMSDNQPIPPWRDLQPREYTSMLFTIIAAKDALPELNTSDLALIASAVEGIGSTETRARLHLDSVCRDVLSGNFSDSAGAIEAASLFAQADRIQEQDIISFFNNLVSSLSPEGADKLVSYKDEIASNNLTANFMDWEKFVALKPNMAFDIIYNNCQDR